MYIVWLSAVATVAGSGWLWLASLFRRSDDVPLGAYVMWSAVGRFAPLRLKSLSGCEREIGRVHAHSRLPSGSKKSAHSPFFFSGYSPFFSPPDARKLLFFFSHLFCTISISPSTASDSHNNLDHSTAILDFTTTSVSATKDCRINPRIAQ